VPFRSEKQRALFYSAGSKKGGAGGVSQETAKKMIADDKPGKLPERVGTRAERMYKHKRSRGNG